MNSLFMPGEASATARRRAMPAALHDLRSKIAGEGRAVVSRPSPVWRQRRRVAAAILRVTRDPYVKQNRRRVLTRVNVNVNDKEDNPS